MRLPWWYSSDAPAKAMASRSSPGRDGLIQPLKGLLTVKCFERSRRSKGGLVNWSFRVRFFAPGGDSFLIERLRKKSVLSSPVEPLLACKEDGSVYAYDGHDQLQLHEIAWSGKVQASLIYDYDKNLMMDFAK